MYKISSFSGNIYLNDIEIIPDDSTKEYCDFLYWVKENTPEYIEITDSEKETLDNEKISKIDAEYKEKISRLVSPYIEKNFFEGTPIPEFVLSQRQALREECRELIQEIKPNAILAKSK